VRIHPLLVRGLCRKARLVITAIEIEGRTVAGVVVHYGISKSWVYQFLARYRAEGEAAFSPVPNDPTPAPPRSPSHRRPGRRTTQGARRRRLDAGPDSIAWHHAPIDIAASGASCVGPDPDTPHVPTAVQGRHSSMPADREADGAAARLLRS
jgi:hypothetical protein